MRTQRSGVPGWSTAAARLAAVCGLGVLILVFHGRSLSYGLFMDDYAHFRQLRACDWSLRGLTDACRLELVGGVIELWWLPETTLRFFRPLAFALLKFTYTATGWSPLALHVASLLWHTVVGLLLVLLLRRLGASACLAWVVAALFAIHPAHVATVQWIACQTELMVATFLLGAALCLGRYQGWPGFGDADSKSGLRWGLSGLALYVLALGCRENAIMFPVVFAGIDVLVGRPVARRRWPLWVALLGLSGLYVAVRSATLGGAQVPPRPYVIRPGEPDFVRFVFDKALYYLLGEYLLTPCVPIAGLPFFQARPLLFYGLSAAVVLVLLAVCLACHRRPTEFLGPAWLLGFMLPVLPVFASPHHLYLPGVGWAITLSTILRAIGRPGSRVPGWWAAARRAAMWCAVTATAAVFAVWTYYCGLVFETGQAVEDLVVEEIAAAPGGLSDGETLYVANLPVIAHYARLAVEERTGRRKLRLIPLTWSPRLLGPSTPTELRWLDDRTVEVRVAHDRYFAGPLGVLIREASGRDVPDEVDLGASYGLHVCVTERDQGGVAALRFTFQRPFAQPGQRLLWGSRARWACQVRP